MTTDCTFEVFTVVARNYIAHARVLAKSLAAHHDGLRLKVVLLDDEKKEISEQEQPFDIIRPSDVDFGRGEFYRMAMIYDVMELATAVKPWVFQHRFQAGAGVVVYLDPDIEVFTALLDVRDLALEHGIVLTPHTTEPLPRDGKIPGEREILIAGTYNLGFIGLGSNTGEFLDWWAERLRRDCRNSIETGLFVDQKWIDLVPHYYGCHILKDPGFNVAYWNLPNRKVTAQRERFLVNGRPLRFFHYSGFSPDKKNLLTKHQGPSPRIVLSSEPALAKLCSSYAEKLIAEGFETWSRIPYAFNTTANGLPIDRRLRRLYFDALIDADNRATANRLPNPFEEKGAWQFLDWLHEPTYPEQPELSRYLMSVYSERSDLRAAFPNIRGEDGRRFLEWLGAGGVVDPSVPPSLLPGPPQKAEAPAVTTKTESKHGVNLYGYVFAESGTGQIGRSLAAAVKAAGIPFSVIPFTETVNRQKNPFSEYGDRAPIYDTNIICVNADQLPVFVSQVGDHMLTDHHNVGIWAWEVEEFPDPMARSAALLDEVWGISRFTADAIARKVERPVMPFPLPIVPPTVETMVRKDLGLDDGFVFLFCFDFESVFQRKNPLAIIDAFTNAFPTPNGARLHIKTVNGHRKPDSLERLRAVAGARRDIRVVDGYMAAGEQLALMNSCDAYVSLHRSEGFGLTLAEAMSFGKPVIATAYSGNMEFTTESNSYLVPYELVSIPPGCDPYPAGSRWADPDIDAAARFMRTVYQDRAQAKRVGERARRDIQESHGPAARGRLLKEWFSTVGPRQPRASAPTPRREPVLSAAPLPPPVPQSSPSVALERASVLVSGPNPDLPSRFPALSRPMRRLMLRLIRNYWVHQREVDRSLLAAVRELSESSRAHAMISAERTSRRVEAVEKAISTMPADQSAQVERIDATLKRVEMTLRRLATQLASADSRIDETANATLKLRNDLDEARRHAVQAADAQRELLLSLDDLRRQAAQAADAQHELGQSLEDVRRQAAQTTEAQSVTNEEIRQSEGRLAGAINELKRIHNSESRLRNEFAAVAGTRLNRLEARLRSLLSDDVNPAAALRAQRLVDIDEVTGHPSSGGAVTAICRFKVSDELADRADGAPVFLAARVIGNAPDREDWNPPRSLPVEPESGESQVRVPLRVPSSPGKYSVQIDAVVEGKFWGSDIGVPPANLSVERKRSGDLVVKTDSGKEFVVHATSERRT